MNYNLELLASAANLIGELDTSANPAPIEGNAIEGTKPANGGNAATNQCEEGLGRSLNDAELHLEHCIDKRLNGVHFSCARCQQTFNCKGCLILHVDSCKQQALLIFKTGAEKRKLAFEWFERAILPDACGSAFEYCTDIYSSYCAYYRNEKHLLLSYTCGRGFFGLLKSYFKNVGNVGIRCGTCLFWHHQECSGLTLKRLRGWKKCLVWTCPNCMPDELPDAQGSADAKTDSANTRTAKASPAVLAQMDACITNNTVSKDSLLKNVEPTMQEKIYLSLLAMADELYKRERIKECLQCLEGALGCGLPRNLEVEVHRQYADVLQKFTKNTDLANAHLQRALSLVQLGEGSTTQPGLVESKGSPPMD